MPKPPLPTILAVLILLILCCASAPAASYPYVALSPSEKVTPVKIDGTIHPDAEWQDAVVLSGFIQRDLGLLAPLPSQPVVFLKVDGENLYLAMRSPVGPEGTEELRAFEKSRDAWKGIMEGDHAVLELAPVSTRSREDLSDLGYFRLVWNAVGGLADSHRDFAPGQKGQGWTSAATLANSVTAGHWDTELKIPLENLLSYVYERRNAIPPAHRTYWSFSIARRFGEEGGNLFSTWDGTELLEDAGGYPRKYDLMPKKAMLRFIRGVVHPRIHTLGPITEGRFHPRLTFHNPTDKPRTVQAAVRITSEKGGPIYQHATTIEISPGKTVAAEGFDAKLKPEMGKLHLQLRIRQDARWTVLSTPPMPLKAFDAELQQQYLRSMRLLREERLP
jgi:hypothetical protein